MTKLYHGDNATSSRFNPFLDAIGRLFEVLCRAAPLGTAIPTKNRALADAAEIESAGQLPALLRRLEAKGLIERVTTSRGSLIVVLQRSWNPDRSWGASQSDLPWIDRPLDPPLADPIAAPDRPERAPAARSTAESAESPQPDAVSTPAIHDRVENGCMVDHVLNQQQQPRACESITQEPLYTRLMAHPDMHEPKARQVVQAGVGTLADFEADLSRDWPGVRNKFFWLVEIWASGKRPNERPTARAAPAPRPDPTANRPLPSRTIWRPAQDALTPAQIAAQLRQLPAPGCRNGA